jgi:hypothetical protein
MGHDFCLAIAWLSNDVRMRCRFEKFFRPNVDATGMFAIRATVKRAKFLGRRRRTNDGEGG